MQDQPCVMQFSCKALFQHLLLLLLMSGPYHFVIQSSCSWKQPFLYARPSFIWHTPCAAQVASLIMQRNVLAARLGRSRSLPPMLGDPHACTRCFQVSNCTLLHKVKLKLE
jgi:hypothetical protein